MNTFVWMWCVSLWCSTKCSSAWLFNLPPVLQCNSKIRTTPATEGDSIIGKKLFANSYFYFLLRWTIFGSTEASSDFNLMYLNKNDCVVVGVSAAICFVVLETKEVLMFRHLEIVAKNSRKTIEHVPLLREYSHFTWN